MDDSAALPLIAVLCELMILIPVWIFMSIVRWKLFEKAGYEGWKGIIPGYRVYVLACEIAGKDITTFVLHFIPFISIYAKIVTYMAVAKSFGKDEGFGVGLFFLSIVFFPMLAFSKKVQYIGPGGIPIKKDSSNSLTPNWQNPAPPANT